MTSNTNRPLWQALHIALDMGWMIAIPLILFALGGRFADSYFDTSPWMFLAGVAIAMISTTVLLVQKFSKILKDINDSTPTP